MFHPTPLGNSQQFPAREHFMFHSNSAMNSNKLCWYIFSYIDAGELKTTFAEIGMNITDKDVKEMMKEVNVQIHGRYVGLLQSIKMFFFNSSLFYFVFF